MKAQISIGAARARPHACRLRRRRATAIWPRATTSVPLTQIAAPNNGDWTRDRLRDARRRLPDGQSGRAGEAGRICLDHLPALRRVRRGRRPSRCATSYVRSGQVSWEYRPYMLFPTDPGIFMLLRCQGADPLLPAWPSSFTPTQSEWGVQAPVDFARAAPAVRNPAARTTRRWPITARPGSTSSSASAACPRGGSDSCLADTSGLERLAEMTQTRARSRASPARRPSSSTANGRMSAPGRSSSRGCARRWEADDECQAAARRLGRRRPARCPPPSRRASARRAAQRDWTQTVARTPEGGFRMGNPDAPVKMIEYLSLTCPHCAAISRGERRDALIRDYVRSGRVSIEYRNYHPERRSTSPAAVLSALRRRRAPIST